MAKEDQRGGRMKVRNKKTGEIQEWDAVGLIDHNRISDVWVECDSIARLNEDWEDYEEPKAYYIGRCGTIEEFDPTKDVALTEMLKEIGNYFETKEDAEKAVEKLKAWKRLKDKGFRFEYYEVYQSVLDECVTAHIHVTINANEVDLKDELDLLFGGK